VGTVTALLGASAGYRMTRVAAKTHGVAARPGTGRGSRRLAPARPLQPRAPVAACPGVCGLACCALQHHRVRPRRPISQVDRDAPGRPAGG